MSVNLPLLERVLFSVAPRWALERQRARVTAAILAGDRPRRRHYEAASQGRRTNGWNRARGDANTVNAMALQELRIHARDLARNNGYARKARRVLSNNVAGWGIVPRPLGPNAKPALELWKKWANKTTCEVEGRHTFAGLQVLVMRAIVTDGEVLIRRVPRKLTDALPLPFQLQVLEAEFLDASRDALASSTSGPIVQGIEYDQETATRRVAYWLFQSHPNGRAFAGSSVRVPANEVAHIFFVERTGQARGVSWFGAAIVPIKDLDEYEDAELMRQKIAACFAGFMTDADGDGSSLGDDDGEDENDNPIEVFEPGMIAKLPPGKNITFGNPPTVLEGSFTQRHLRRIAAALGVTYEDLTGDYSQVNYSSARMARIAHWSDINDYRFNMIIPLMCEPIWKWFMEAAVFMGHLPEAVETDWTPPPMAMLEPDKEGQAYKTLMRNGIMTPDEVIREQGGDPESHWAELAANYATFDRLKIMLDCDPRKTSNAGLTQARPGIGDSTTPDPSDEVDSADEESAPAEEKDDGGK